MEDAGGEYVIMPECAGGDVLHVHEVLSDAHYGFGVADEAAGAERDGGVVFAGGGRGHAPKAGGA